MIRELKIDNFKCFAGTRFSFDALNVLTGKNAAGKSSVLQCLLLAKEAAEMLPSNPTIKLNGPYELELGTVLDVIRHGSTDNKIGFVLSSDEFNFACEFHGESEFQEDHFLTLLGDKPSVPSILSNSTTCAFTYLSAERLGPRDTLGIQSFSSKTLQIGVRGEFVAELLSTADRRREKVRDALIHPIERESPSPNTLVLRQLELWLGEIFDEVRVRPEYVPGTNVTYIRVERGPVALAETERPTNMGFGVSYCLPIMVAGLLAPSPAIMIIENPEAHLHPAAQSKLAQFLARVAASGVQVFVETHSDHILNGFRLAVKSGIIRAGNVSLKFFERGKSDVGLTIHEPTIRDDGNIDNWPPGFFDQMTNDLEHLLGF
jgi:predicted ATPase